MLKFVLRLFVVLAVGFVISNEIVDRSANYLFEPVSDAYTRESVRGQIHSLVQELSRIEPASRQTHIDDQLAPYYGLRLRVVNARDYNASDKERQAIRAGDFFIRDKMQTFVAGIPGAGGQWLELAAARTVDRTLGDRGGLFRAGPAAVRVHAGVGAAHLARSGGAQDGGAAHGPRRPAGARPAVAPFQHRQSG